MPYFIAIGEESVVKKSVGQKEVAANYGKIQKFTEDKATEVDVVLVVDVSAEELNQLFPLLILVLDKPTRNLD